MTTLNTRDPNQNPDPPTIEDIAAEAYAIYQREGAVDGRDVDHWLRAEATLRERQAGASHPSREQGRQSHGEKEGREENSSKEDKEGGSDSPVGPRGASQGTQAVTVPSGKEPREGAGEASGTTVPEPGGQHAGSGQVQRRDDQQAVQPEVRHVGPRDQEQQPPPEQSGPEQVSGTSNQPPPPAGAKRKAPTRKKK